MKTRMHFSSITKTISGRYQKGAATLLTSTILLMGIGLVVVMSANFGASESKIVANDYLNAQAEASALAGMNDALALLDQSNLDTYNSAKKTLADSNNNSIGCYEVQITKNNQAASNAWSNVTVSSTGFSGNGDHTADPNACDDSSGIAQYSVSQTLLFAVPFSPNLFSFLDYTAVITAGDTSLRREAQITSNYKHVRASGTITCDDDCSNVSTFVPQDFNGNLTDPFFYVFGTPWNNRNTVKAFSRSKDCGVAGCTNPTELTDTSARGKINWITGGLTLNNVTIGTVANPVILVVDNSGGGAFSMRNGAVVNGLVFVANNWNNGSNTGSIHGALVVKGNFTSTTQNFGVTLETNVFDNFGKIGFFTPQPGSWIDG